MNKCDYLLKPFQIKYPITFLMKPLPVVKNIRSSRPEVFLGKGVLKICSKFTGEHPCQINPSLISIGFQRNFIEMTLRHGCFPVDLLHIFRTPFPKNTSGWLLLKNPLSIDEIIKKLILHENLVYNVYC